MQTFLQNPLWQGSDLHPMKTILITLTLSLASLVGILVLSKGTLSDLSPYTRYYVTAAIAISGAVAAISMFKLLMMANRGKSSSAHMVNPHRGQRRESYRIGFDPIAPALFVEAKGKPLSLAAFSCAVKDLSETGLSLFCTGVYATGQTVHGEVIFPSGRTVQIHGSVVREELDQTCLTLHCTIDPSIFMAEQRERIESEKSIGPRPAVSQGALEESSTTLPSHRPKGICRKK